MLKGVSVLISAALIILITMIAIGLALTIGIPTIERAKESGVLNQALLNMRILDNSIREVASEGTGSFRSINTKVSDGEYKINEKTNSLEFIWELKSGIITPGTFVKEGNVILASGVEAKTGEYDLDGDGADDLVLENEVLRIGISKNGTSASQVPINTSKLIKIFNFKETAVNITPTDSRIILDDFIDTHNGTGYTEFVRSGDNLVKAEVIAHVNSTNVVYDVVYTLQSGADFLIVKIQNAYYK